MPTTTLPNNNLQPALPIAPQEPELAKNVTVMGVIQIGEQTQAIVQVPSEATSRYVQVGQRLSNGQVLVKRIELNAGAEPLVVLEQYGVEVSKAVGEIAPSPGQPTAALPVPTQSTNAPTAAVPYLPPQSTNAPTAELPRASAKYQRAHGSNSSRTTTKYQRAHGSNSSRTTTKYQRTHGSNSSRTTTKYQRTHGNSAISTHAKHQRAHGSNFNTSSEY